MAEEKRKTKEVKGSLLYERLGLRALYYPVTPHANTLPFSLGGLTLVGILIQVVTGIILVQYYHPDPNFARESVAYINSQVYLGWFVRGIHYWSAHLLAILVLLHLVRVIFTGSYQRPREVTWYLGVLLFALTFGAILSGSILKWDQEGFEALLHVVETGEMVGILGLPLSPHFTGSTALLARVFAVHISLLVVALAILIAGHFYLVKVLEISPLPWGTEEEKSQKFTDHLKGLAKYGTGFLAVVSLLALLLTPPLGAKPINIESGIKPWWMFLWIYALENLMGVQAILWGSGVLGLFLIALPLLDRKKEGPLPEGVWGAVAKRKVALGISFLVFAALIGLAFYGWVAPPGHLE
jgi:ubiquinol-cytochrome c reductase cytochrome b subunit